LVPIDYIQGLTRAELTGIIMDGSDEEPTEALLERYLTKVQKPSTSGNRYDYYNWAMECEGVGAAKVFPLSSGPGTVKVIIADANMSAAGTGLLEMVRGHIEELRPIGADVTVASVVEKAVNVSAGIKLQAGMNLGVVQNAFQAKLTGYLHNEALDLSYVSLARVGNLLLGTEGVEDYSNLLLNGVSGNVALMEDEIAVAGTVTLEVG
jgi:baseplate J-like protein